MAENFRVWLVHYEGPTPKSWDSNPNEGFITKRLEPPFELTLSLANAVARGFNEKEISSPVKVQEWAIIMPDDAEFELGQQVNIRNVFVESN